MAKKVKLYALSTCGWCKRTVQWLEENRVECDTIYVDKLEGPTRETKLDEMKQFNPRKTFPTVVIDEGKCVIIGYKPEELEKELK